MIMEFCVVTHANVTDFMPFTLRQLGVMKKAFINVMRAKADAARE